MSIATVITQGYGSFGDVAHIITLGYGSKASTAKPVDTHDGFDSEIKRHEEKRETRERLRAQILHALDGPQAMDVRAEIAPYAQESEAKPFIETVDFERLSANIKNLKALTLVIQTYDLWRALEARDADIEADDEDVLLLI